MEDLKETIRQLKYEYDSGHGDHLARDFFSPCLEASSFYKRETSDFTSNVLVDWASALPKIVDKENDQCQIQMIAHPNLSKDDKTVLEKTLDDKDRDEYLDQIADHIILGAEEFAKGNRDRTLRLELFYWLITTKRMILKFAFPKHIPRPGIFHKKVGIFHFPWGDKVAFQGGANETVGGMHRNIESIDVYHSWKEEGMERINEKERKFDLAWNDKAEGYQTKRLSQKTLDRCSAHSPFGHKLPTLLFEKKLVKETSSEDGKKLWPHQEEAIEKFLDVKNGVLEMATGTGKTYTSLKITERLFKQNKINSLIITTEGNDLLDQWQKEVRSWTKQNDFKDLLHR